MKLLPEKLAVDDGAGMGELSAPLEVLRSAESQRAPRLTPVPTGAILILGRVAKSAPAAPTEPPPLRLTEVVEPARAVEREQEPQDPEETGWTGAALRRARETRGLSLSALAESTKITRHHLENIEDDRYDRLPSYVYLRGILLSLARELKLDGARVCRSYIENARRLAGDLH